METNLERLDRLFPDVLALNPEQVGKSLGWDRKKIYRAIEAKSFPFPILRTGNLITIPKIGYAKWLDGGMLDASPTPQPPAPLVAEEPLKRKRGRPRKALAAAAFQRELQFELERHILTEAISTAVAALKPRAVDGGETEGIRNQLMDALGSVEAIRERADLHAASGKKRSRGRI
jgi:predicted DNA-binding transcriptional regulator AlpA